MNVRARLLHLLSLGLTLSATACAWPQAGSGGLAERQRAQTPAIEQASATLDRLAAAGGDRFAAADMVDARLILTRARREYAGGMTVAADANMTRLGTAIDRIESRLSAPTPAPAAATVLTTKAAAPIVNTTSVPAPVVTTYATRPPASAPAVAAPVPLLR